MVELDCDKVVGEDWEGWGLVVVVADDAEEVLTKEGK